MRNGVTVTAFEDLTENVKCHNEGEERPAESVRHIHSGAGVIIVRPSQFQFRRRAYGGTKNYCHNWGINRDYAQVSKAKQAISRRVSQYNVWICYLFIIHVLSLFSFASQLTHSACKDAITVQRIENSQGLWWRAPNECREKSSRCVSWTMRMSVLPSARNWLVSEADLWFDLLFQHVDHRTQPANATRWWSWSTLVWLPTLVRATRVRGVRIPSKRGHCPFYERRRKYRIPRLESHCVWPQDQFKDDIVSHLMETGERSGKLPEHIIFALLTDFKNLSPKSTTNKNAVMFPDLHRIIHRDLKPSNLLLNRHVRHFSSTFSWCSFHQHMNATRSFARSYESLLLWSSAIVSWISVASDWRG